MTQPEQYRFQEIPTRVIEAGCAVLHERVAEAYEPAYRELVMRIFDAMQEAYGANAEIAGGTHAGKE